jgi:hypothetical protein
VVLAVVAAIVEPPPVEGVKDRAFIRRGCLAAGRRTRLYAIRSIGSTKRLRRQRHAAAAKPLALLPTSLQFARLILPVRSEVLELQTCPCRAF